MFIRWWQILLLFKVSSFVKSPICNKHHANCRLTNFSPTFLLLLLLTGLAAPVVGRAVAAGPRVVARGPVIDVTPLPTSRGGLLQTRPPALVQVVIADAIWNKAGIKIAVLCNIDTDQKRTNHEKPHAQEKIDIQPIILWSLITFVEQYEKDNLAAGYHNDRRDKETRYNKTKVFISCV